MDLKNFPFPEGIRLANAQDNQAILDFYSSSALAGKSLSLRSDRSPDFFKFLHYQSAASDVLLYEDRKGELSGIGSVCYRKGMIDGASKDVGYLGDFRVAFSRPVIRVWRKFYGDFLKYLSLPMITAVIDDNKAATNALVERSNKEFSYQLLTPYKMVNILNRLPFKKKVPGVTVRRALQSDRKALEKFLDQQSLRHAFGYDFSRGELERRFATWNGFSIGDFYLATEAQQIVGCLATWNPFEAKRNVLEKIPLHYQFYRPFISMPRIGEALKPIYLTHVEIFSEFSHSKRAAVFRALVDEVEWSVDAHMISFCDFSHNGFADSLKGYLLNQIPMKLFTVAATDEQPQLSPEQKQEPGFEIALV